MRAPVADVVIGDDLVAKETRDARKAIAENGRADVTDVHRLGNVRRGEIEHDGARCIDKRDAESVIGRGGLGASGIDCGLDAEIDKPRPRDFGGGDRIGWPSRDDLFGQRAWVHFLSLGENHRGIRLVVAESQVIRRGDWGSGGRAENFRKNGGERSFELLAKSHSENGGRSLYAEKSNISTINASQVSFAGEEDVRSEIPILLDRLMKIFQRGGAHHAHR